ncbi:hypothetical protein CWE12_11400 [Aliidiomarina sedimenti]|uniref:Uncharacterized protein n=1 Tax=Aliidiomarina sedimenti TaxID=1933879 RepID=A0ABY0BX31_9GAMM|nr:hypothetical protein [Aliidiomarina sedimenti]RUO28892.1 hypothetical protein CWE12_11400 [Aliidiomarina sedimenti]
MNKAVGALALIFSLCIGSGIGGTALASESNEKENLSLPHDCFDSANTVEPCQTLYRYAELLGFANIPDYVGFIQSIIAEERGEAAVVPLRDTVEFKRFIAVMNSDERPTAALQQEMAQFLSHRFQVLADVRHAQDWVSMQIQEAFFFRLADFNAGLFPELDELAAIEATFLQANPRLTEVLRQLSPLTEGEGILVEGDDPPQVLSWLTSLYGLGDEYATQALLLELVNLDSFGGNPFDLMLLDQRPGIGPLLNMPLDSPIVMTKALQEDIALLQQASSTDTANTLQNIHFYEPFRINNLLSLLAFAASVSESQPRIPYARSTSLVDLHLYLETEVFAQLMDEAGASQRTDAAIVATILALRSGASLPAVGSRLVQLEDVQNGNYAVVELTPFTGRLIDLHVAGYENNAAISQAD